MKIALTIIAHNEEKNIEKCLLSALNQSVKPSEIVVVCHNCTDKTEEIARKFKEVKTVVLNGSAGVVYARAKAYDSVSSEAEIVAATDGDSFLTKKWLEKLTKPFEDERVVATGGIIYFPNSVYANLMTLSFFFLDPLLKMNHFFYFWGASHAFRKSVYEKSGGLKKLFEIKEVLGLHYWVDDLYLSLLLRKFGKVQAVRDSIVWTRAPKLNFAQWLERGGWQHEDRKKIFKYFGLE